MKKLILFLLTAALLILPLSGCFADNKQDEGTTPNNTTENTTPEDTKPYYNPGPDETTPEVTTPDNPPEVTPPEVTTDNPVVEKPQYDRPQELEAVFSLIEQDLLTNEKMSANLDCYEDLHFQLKESGWADDLFWSGAYFTIRVYCNYELATSQPWYLKAEVEVLNKAFYNYCNTRYDFHWDYLSLRLCEGLYMTYHSDGMYPTNESIEKFLADYEIAKELSELGYVTRIIVNFNYSLPYDYWT